MLNFQAVRNNEISSTALVAGLTPADLQDLTHEMVDTMLTLIAG